MDDKATAIRASGQLLGRLISDEKFRNSSVAATYLLVTLEDP
jgi:hypothetical protein